ncbi:MAG: ATP-binding protein [Polyangiaceae bacterium]
MTTSIPPAFDEALDPAPRCEDAVAILDALSAAVLAARSDGVITWANPWAARVLRRSRASIIGRNLADVLPLSFAVGEDTPSEHRRGELTYQADDGSRCQLGFSLARRAVTAPDEVAIIALFQEISSLIELRRQRDRLLQMAALGDALPAVLHEVRNPLAAITTALEVLTEDEGPLQADLHAVLNEARRATLTLDGLGGLARETHSRKWEAIDHAVAEATRVLEPTAARRGISLRTTGPALPLLPLDRAAISGVVFNLVRNAIDACGEGDVVAVEARLPSPNEFLLEVRDTGHGMSVPIVKRCTELFFTTKDTGSGIGLALCKRFAESSGGSLEVESELGRGTTVSVRVALRTDARGG